MTTDRERIDEALDLAFHYGGTDGAHHKAWVIDQMIRALTGCPIVQDTRLDCYNQPYTFDRMGESEEYLVWVRAARDGEDGPETYDWDTGIAP